MQNQFDGTTGAFTPTPYILRGDEGETILLDPYRTPVTIKISPKSGSSRISMGTEQVAPGTHVPIHLHEYADEIIFIHAGEGKAFIKDQEHIVRAGDTLFIPKGIWHGVANITAEENLHFIWIFAPAGMEDYFRAADVSSRATQHTGTEHLATFGQDHIRYRETSLDE